MPNDAPKERTGIVAGVKGTPAEGVTTRLGSDSEGSVGTAEDRIKNVTPGGSISVKDMQTRSEMNILPTPRVGADILSTATGPDAGAAASPSGSAATGGASATDITSAPSARNASRSSASSGSGSTSAP
jgi:hypothetical protein